VKSPYYQSESFGKVLAFMAKHPRRCQLREVKGRRSVVISPIRSITEAYAVLKEIQEA